MTRFAEKMKSARAALVIVASMAVVLGTLSGCASSAGTKVEQSDIAFMVKGKTKKQEVVSKLGQPSGTSVRSDGSEQLIWAHSKSTIDGKSFIPFVGIFAGGTSTESKTLSAEFNKKGILTNYEWSTGGSSASTSMQ